MSILETFLILFDSDAEGVKKGAKEAGAATDSLSGKVKATDMATARLGSSFYGLALRAAGAIGAILSISAITHGITAAADYADNLNDVSQALGVNIEELDAWGAAVKLNGGTAESFQGSLGNLVTSFAQISTTGKSRALPFFKELGISMTDSKGKVRDVMDVLPELADSFQKLSKAQAFGMGQKLGLDQGTIQLLQQGRRAVEDVIKRQKELGVVTKEDAEIAADFNDAVDDSNRVMRNMYMAIGSLILPVITKLMHGLELAAKFIKKYKYEFEGAMIVVTAVLAAYTVQAIRAAIATGAFSLPLILIVAGVLALGAALALVYGDIMNFIAGNDSLYGRLEKWAPGLREFRLAFVEAFQDVIEWVTKAYDVLAPFIDILSTLMNPFDFKGKFELVNKLVGGAKDGIATASNSPISAQSAVSMSTNSTAFKRSNSVVIQKVEVNTQATDAVGISKSISSPLQTHVGSALNNADDGVAY